MTEMTALRSHRRGGPEVLIAVHGVTPTFCIVAIAATFTLEHGREAFESRGQRPRKPGKTVLVVRDE